MFKNPVIAQFSGQHSAFIPVIRAVESRSADAVTFLIGCLSVMLLSRNSEQVMRKPSFTDSGFLHHIIKIRLRFNRQMEIFLCRMSYAFGNTALTTTPRNAVYLHAHARRKIRPSHSTAAGRVRNIFTPHTIPFVKRCSNRITKCYKAFSNYVSSLIPPFAGHTAFSSKQPAFPENAFQVVQSVPETNFKSLIRFLQMQLQNKTGMLYPKYQACSTGSFNQNFYITEAVTVPCSTGLLSTYFSSYNHHSTAGQVISGDRRNLLCYCYRRTTSTGFRKTYADSSLNGQPNCSTSHRRAKAYSADRKWRARPVFHRIT
jgi:hypothetical protein